MIVVEDAVSAIAASGIPGALLVVLGFAYWQLMQKLTAVQEARVADAQKVAAAALEREEKWQATLVDLTKAIENMLERQEERRRNT